MQLVILYMIYFIKREKYFLKFCSNRNTAELTVQQIIHAFILLIAYGS